MAEALCLLTAGLYSIILPMLFKLPCWMWSAMVRNFLTELSSWWTNIQERKKIYFPVQTYNWERIKTEIAPLVGNVIKKIEGREERLKDP